MIVFVCVESGYLFGTFKEVQVRLGFPDVVGKAHLGVLKRKVAGYPLVLPPFTLSGAL